LAAILGAVLGTLYIVATPIGNLSDITARALQVLGSVSLIAAEDTRHTGKLLAHFGIKTSVISYHTFNERARRERLLAALAEGDVALVSDAGTPAIADPGHDLVESAIEAGFAVSPIPGPSSVTAAISASGLIDGPFLVLGFLPRKGNERTTILAKAASTRYPTVIFEAPSRIAKTLNDLATLFGNRSAVVARELTKIHEEFRRGSLDDLAEAFALEETKGEFVIIVAGDNMDESFVDDDDAVLRRLLTSGLKPSDAAREAAALTGKPRSDLYDLAVQISKAQKLRDF
jgi:16S rRNA (cytidine1402-2'-O)-methyltransferase